MRFHTTFAPIQNYPREHSEKLAISFFMISEVFICKTTVAKFILPILSCYLAELLEEQTIMIKISMRFSHKFCIYSKLPRDQKEKLATSFFMTSEVCRCKKTQLPRLYPKKYLFYICWWTKCFLRRFHYAELGYFV